MYANKPAIDVTDYVDWLLSQPLHKSVPRMDFEEAVDVARTLQAIHRVTGKELVGQLGQRVLNLALELTAGDLASLETCVRFLRDFSGIYLDPNRCDSASQVVQGLTPEQKAALKSETVQDQMMHYRGALGAEYKDREGKRHWPKDDQSPRLADLYWALREAGCPQPVAFLAARLDWTTNRVETRLKPYKNSQPSSWLGFPYRMRYWLQLDPANENRRDIEEQPFVFKWEAPPDWGKRRRPRRAS